MATDVSMIYGAFLCGPFGLGCGLWFGLYIWVLIFVWVPYFFWLKVPPGRVDLLFLLVGVEKVVVFDVFGEILGF